MSPSSSGVRFGMRVSSAPPATATMPRGQLAQARDDVADDKQPDDQNRPPSGSRRRSPSSQKRLFSSADADSVLGIRSLPLRRRRQAQRPAPPCPSRHAATTICKRTGGSLLRQFVGANLKQAVLARAESRRACAPPPRVFGKSLDRTRPHARPMLRLPSQQPLPHVVEGFLQTADRVGLVRGRNLIQQSRRGISVRAHLVDRFARTARSLRTDGLTCGARAAAMASILSGILLMAFSRAATSAIRSCTARSSWPSRSSIEAIRDCSRVIAWRIADDRSQLRQIRSTDCRSARSIPTCA